MLIFTGARDHYFYVGLVSFVSAITVTAVYLLFTGQASADVKSIVGLIIFLSFFGSMSVIALALSVLWHRPRRVRLLASALL